MHVMTPLSLTTAMIIAASAWAAPTAAPSVEVQQAIRAAEQLSLAFEAAATRVGPSVVKIGTAGIVPANANPWTRRRGTMMVESTGSGIIISPDGHVLTNAHVVSQADRVIVTLHDGRRFEAESVGIDHGADLAVLRIDATKLHPAELAHNTTPRIGQWVLAVGSPFGLGHSFSAGIVSATGRSNLGLSEFEHLIQTDAAINPGNSGGPLVDLHGRVIGINVAIKSISGSGSGVGFAVPADMVHRVATSLIEHGKVERGYLGVMLGQRDPHVQEQFGPDVPLCFIQQVEPNTPAQQAGLQAGDLLLRINNHPIRTHAQARHAIATCRPGESCFIEVQRNDTTIRASVVPADRRTAMEANLRQRRRGGQRP